MNHLRAMRQDYLGFVSGLQRQHPDVAHLKVFNEHITHVFRPDWVREILVDQADALIRWERATHVFSLAMGQSVLVTEGAQWQRQRRMLQPGFAPKRVAGYAALMTQSTHEALSTLATTHQGIDIEALMTRVTLDVILRTLFGEHQVSDARPVAEAIQTLSLRDDATLYAFFMAHVDAAAVCAPRTRRVAHLEPIDRAAYPRTTNQGQRRGR